MPWSEIPKLTTETIAVAMSGGVDSSTVAAMLRAEGHSVIGLTMQLWNQRRLAGRYGMPESVQGRCCSLDDVYDARQVAQHIGIPYYVVNHEDSFERDVIRPFIREYLSGRTPIPCSLCNHHLKLEQLQLVARQIGAERVATGQQARVAVDPNRQRKGLGVATGSPLYVIQISVADKQVVVGNDEHLYSRTLRARRVNLISLAKIREPMRVSVKIRHRHEPAPAIIENTGEDEILVTFDQPQRAITPGQAAVFYDGDIVVGGGWIS